MLPEPTRHWIEVVSLHVDMAVSRARGEAVAPSLAIAAESAARAQSAAVARTHAVIATMVTRLGLSAEEELAAWTLVAAQLEPSLGGRLEAMSGGPEVTQGALARIAYASAPARAIRELTSAGRLYRFGLVEHADATSTSWARRTIRATERLLGLAMMDEDLTPSARPYIRPERDVPAPPELVITPAALVELREAMSPDATTVVVVGLPSAGRSTSLVSVLREFGMQALEVDARRMARDLPTFTAELRVIGRECRLLGRVPVFENLDAISDEMNERISAIGAELVPLLDGPVFATTTKAMTLRWDRPTVVIELGVPSSRQVGALWLSALETGSDSDARRLAGQYPLASGLVVRAATAAKARARGRKLAPGDIGAAIRATLDDRLGQFAKRLTTTQTWDDLVLPRDQAEIVVELLARIRERQRVYEDWRFAAKLGKGLGVSALFSGPPGTGKTMLAAVIARELGLELYQVDLGKVVSKYIGETEKNLGALFDAAEAGHAIVLFDEADSLFGKRTDVKSSNDRYANLETNYLLQRLESFTGICMLTSNHETNIDPAFLRRLSLHLRFDLPDETEREHLWQAMLPQAAPRAPEIDFTRLARTYEMSGGYIRNAALRAAFLAADGDGVITYEHLCRAARLECEAIGKIAA